MDTIHFDISIERMTAPGGCVNIKMFYQFKYSHYKEKTVSRAAYLYNGNAIHGNTVSISRRGPGICKWQGFIGITVYPKKYAHGFVLLCFVVVMQSFIMNAHEVFIHIHQGFFAGTEAIVRLPQCQWSKPDGYGKISQCITTTKHSKAKTVCIFLGIYCSWN